MNKLGLGNNLNGGGLTVLCSLRVSHKSHTCMIYSDATISLAELLNGKGDNTLLEIYIKNVLRHMPHTHT
jgi:hypothetical protein